MTFTLFRYFLFQFIQKIMHGLGFFTPFGGR
jgi:hypothetical protein